MSSATTESELLDALRRNPADVAALHVYADFLMSNGDTRGELLLLQQREAELDDAASLERLLELSAEHGFLRVPDDPDADTWRWKGGSRIADDRLWIEYRVVHDGHRYGVIDTPARNRLAIWRDDKQVRDLDTRNATMVSLVRPEATNVILTLIGAAIREDRLEHVGFPSGLRLEQHPAYRPGRFPTEPVPPTLAVRWDRCDDWELELRDLTRWRHVLRRWIALTK